MKTRSLTRRLTITVLLLELLSFAALVSAALLYERHTHFAAFDVMLRGRADSLLGAVQDADDADDNVLLDTKGLALRGADLYRVEDEKGRVLGESDRKGWQNSVPTRDGSPWFKIDGKEVSLYSHAGRAGCGPWRTRWRIAHDLGRIRCAYRTRLAPKSSRRCASTHRQPDCARPDGCRNDLDDAPRPGASL